MIWQNPLAFAGLIALGVPILIHLLSRQKARVEQFPTLRFLPDVQSAPVRRTRITDRVLLALRLLIFIAAVAALAQPLLLTNARRAFAERTVARAIVVDTSASMQRPSLNGSAADAARRAAQSLDQDAAAGMIIETGSPATVIAGASSWLAAQGGRRELVILSDFQTGSLDSIDLGRVVDGVSVRLERIPVTDSAMVRADSSARAIALFTGAATRAAAAAARVAAGVAALDSARARIVLVYPDAPARAQLIAEATPVRQPELGDAVVQIRRNALVSATMFIAPVAGTETTSLLRVAGGAQAQSVVLGGEVAMDGRRVLMLFPSFSEGSLASAALIAAAGNALRPETPAAELDPRVVSDATLRAWEQLTTNKSAIPAATSGASDGRWFWLAALVFIVAESVVRRRVTRAEVARAAS